MRYLKPESTLIDKVNKHNFVSLFKIKKKFKFKMKSLCDKLHLLF